MVIIFVVHLARQLHAALHDVNLRVGHEIMNLDCLLERDLAANARTILKHGVDVSIRSLIRALDEPEFLHTVHVALDQQLLELFLI